MAKRWNIPLFSKAVFNVWLLDAKRKYDWIKPWLGDADTVLEVGAGPGSVTAVLRGFGHDVTGLDIADNAFSPDLASIVYDGDRMPFDDGAFDIATILTTLHHTRDPDRIIAEAQRVARRLIIIEDVYETRVQEIYTKLADKLTNLEFIGHPHSNRSDSQWLESFDRHGLNLVYHRIYPLLGIFQQAVYVLEPKRC